MKRWWSQELTALRTETRCLRQRAYAKRHKPSDMAHAKYQASHDRYANKIEKAKRDHWEELLDCVDERTMWTAHKFVSAEATDGGCTRILTLTAKREDGTMWCATTSEEKAKMLFNTFFPAPDSEQANIDDSHDYPPNVFDFAPITDKQIRREIGKLNPFKVPGSNGIPNAMIKQCADTLLLFLGPLFWATFMESQEHTD